MHGVKTKFASALLAASGFCLPHAPLSAAAQTERATATEEVVVVARRREERLQDTPVSVTALSGGDLASRSLDGVSDLESFVPNLSFTSGASASPSAAQLFIRGVGQQDFLPTFDPGVGVYVDGVYIARAVGAQFDFADLARVEVLRGPQGTLFGRNTIGGAINLISNEPGDSFEGLVEVTVGDYDRQDVRAMANLPVAEDFAVRLSAATLNRDGFGTRPNVGDEQGVVERDLFRLSAKWRPASRVTLLAAADYTETNETPLPQSNIALDTNQFPLRVYNSLVAGGTIDSRFISNDPFVNFGTEPNVSEVQNWGASLTATVEFDAFTLKSITAQRETDATFSRAFENTPFPIAETITTQKHEQFSQEVQAFGNAFEDRLDWIVGAYYFQEDVRDVADVTLFRGLFDALEAQPGTIPGPPPPAPQFGGPNNPANLNLDLPRIETNLLDNRSTALFGEVTLALTPQWSLIAGARYTWEEKDYRFTRVLPRTNRTPINDAPASESFESFTPKVGLQWRPNAQAQLYATYTEGFKSGGFNGRPTNERGITPFDEEKVRSYEVGLKSDLFERRLRANFAVFYSDYEDLQVGINRPVGPTTEFFVDNAAQATIKGFEAELTAVPLEGLVLNGNVGYVDAEFDEVRSNAPFSVNAEFAEVPEWTYALGAEYTMNVVNDLSLAGRLDWAWKDDTWHDLTNTRLIRTDAYGLLNGRLTLRTPGDRLEFAVFGTNLTDETYLTYGSAGFGLFNGTYGRPREWGVSATARF